MHAKWIALTLMLALGATPAFAKHAGKKEKFQEGDCKVERKWKKDGRYEEKRRCAPVVITLPPVVILPAGY